MRLPKIRLNLPLLVISFLLALLLWVFVQAQTMEMKSVVETVPLKVMNLDPQYVVTSMDDSVRVTAEGPSDAIANPLLKDMVGVVDLRGAKPGAGAYPMVVTAPDPIVLGLLGRTHYKIPVSLEQKAAKSFMVSVEPRGRVGDRTLQFEAAAVRPDRVTYFGPASKVRSIVRVRVLLDLGEIDPDNLEVGFALVPEPLDSKDRPVSGVDTTSRVIEVRPSLGAAAVEKSVFVVPLFTGRPPRGYQVTDYTAEPREVTVTGTSIAIEQTSRISTEPIDLTSMTSPRTVAVRLSVPNGLKLVRDEPVTVSVQVERTNIAPQVPTEHKEPPFPDHVPPLEPAPKKGGG